MAKASQAVGARLVYADDDTATAARIDLLKKLAKYANVTQEGNTLVVRPQNKATEAKITAAIASVSEAFPPSGVEELAGSARASSSPEASANDFLPDDPDAAAAALAEANAAEEAARAGQPPPQAPPEAPVRPAGDDLPKALRQMGRGQRQAPPVALAALAAAGPAALQQLAGGGGSLRGGDVPVAAYPTEVPPTLKVDTAPPVVEATPPPLTGETTPPSGGMNKPKLGKGGWGKKGAVAAGITALLMMLLNKRSNEGLEQQMISHQSRLGAIEQQRQLAPTTQDIVQQALMGDAAAQRQLALQMMAPDYGAGQQSQMAGQAQRQAMLMQMMQQFQQARFEMPNQLQGDETVFGGV